MKLVLLKKKNIFTKREGFEVAGKKIGAFQGYPLVEKKELIGVIRRANEVWKRVYSLAKVDSFTGHVRFDFVPEFNSEVRKEGLSFDLGDLSVDHLYEINAHSPEGAACDSLFGRVFPDLAGNRPSAAKKLAQTISEFVFSDISMVKGVGPAKDSWISYFFNDLRKTGLSVNLKSPDQIKKEDPKLIWRWGDIDFRGVFNEYDLDFQKWMLSAQKNGTFIINSLPQKMESDVANKKFLATEDDLILEEREDFLKALNSSDKKNDYVLKPLRGSSGKGIVFGDRKTENEWKDILVEAYNFGGCGLFKKKLLPKIDIGKESIAMDFLPSFFAVNEELYYLYTLVRMEPWESYIKERTINVVRGGGYGGTLAVEK